MPIYQYLAMTESGKPKRGMVDADSAREARQKLRLDRLYVTEIAVIDQKGREGSKETAEVKQGLKREIRLPKIFERRMGVRELAIVTRQLALLLKSGLPLSETLNAMVEQAGDATTERIFRDLREKIASGSPLAEALARHPKTFSNLYVNMVRAGEASGTLDSVLTRLADYIQRQASLRGKVSSALTYPVILIFLGTAVVIFLMSYVVPKITKILEQRKQALPMPTEILMTVSAFFKSFWWVLILVAIGVVVVYRMIVRTKHGRLLVDAYKLRMPLFGPLLKKQAVARFANTFSTLLKSGLPALDSLKIVAQVVNNALLTKVIDEIHSRILEGADIATPVKRSRVFPPGIGHMIAVGEESGQLEEVLDRVAEAYEEEIGLTIQRMTAMMEPLILIVLAAVVLMIILAVLLPLMQMQNM
jgi:general secretion pathway protein F